MALSIDLRKRILEAVDNKSDTIANIAKRFAVGKRTIFSLLKLRRETNDIIPRPLGNLKGHSHTITDWKAFEQFVKEHTHLTAPAMCVEWEKINGRRIAKSVMKRGLKKLGYTFKKNSFAMQNQTRKNVLIFYKKSVQ